MKIEKKLFFPSLIILIVVIIAIGINLDFLQASVGAIYDGCISTFGWLFIFADICAVLGTFLLIYIIIFKSKYFEDFWNLIFKKKEKENAV